MQIINSSAGTGCRPLPRARGLSDFAVAVAALAAAVAAADSNLIDLQGPGRPGRSHRATALSPSGFGPSGARGRGQGGRSGLGYSQTLNRQLPSNSRRAARRPGSPVVGQPHHHPSPPRGGCTRSAPSHAARREPRGSGGSGGSVSGGSIVSTYGDDAVDDAPISQPPAR